MAKIEFSASLTTAVHQAQLDRAKAIKALELMVPYLDERRALPAALAQYLSAAIKAAVASEQPDRVLAERLHLRRRAGRPGIDMIAVGKAVKEELYRYGATSINDAAERVSKKHPEFGGLDISTIKKHHREYARLCRLAVQSSGDPNPETRWGDS